MKLIWSAAALDALEHIFEQIAADNPAAAAELSEYIVTTVAALLPANPQIGRPGRVVLTRELVVHASYIVVYQLSSETIEIVTIRHTARLWPEAF